MKPAALAGCLLALGCASRPGLSTRWHPLSALRDVKKGSDDADAVILHRSEQILLAVRLNDPSYRHQLFHDVVWIRTEAGLAWAEVKVPLFKDSRLIELRGRVIQPDGSVHEVAEAQMLEQKAETDVETRITERVFRFPDVRVDSIVEYAYTIESPGFPWFQRGRAHAGLPIREFEFVLQGPPQIIWAVRAYNTRVPFQISNDGDGWTVAWSMKAIPAYPDEAYDPHWTFKGPWWAFRIVQFSWPGGAFDAIRDWKGGLQDWGKRAFLDDKLFVDFTERLDTAGCAGKRACVVEAAVDFVRERTDFNGYGELWDARPLREVLDSGWATGFEQGILLRRLLADAGVEAQLGAVTRKWTEVFDHDFPGTDSFNHLLVYLPAAGDEKALWLDPACAYCAPGELPSTMLGVMVVRFSASRLSGFRPTHEATLESVAGKLSPVTERFAGTFDLELDASGEAKVVSRRELSGEWAVSRRRETRTRSGDEHRKDAEQQVRRVSPTAQLTTHEPVTCDERRATCREVLTFRYPSVATVDGDRLVVPVASFWPAPFEEELLRDDRRMDAVFRFPHRFDYVVRIRPPAGFTAGALPAERVETSPAMTTRTRYALEGSTVVLTSSLDVRPGAYPRSELPRALRPAQSFVDVGKDVLVFNRRRAAAAH